MFNTTTHTLFKRLLVGLVALTLQACPSPTKMPYPTPDVGKDLATQDPGAPGDNNTQSDPGPNLEDTSVPDASSDALADSQQSTDTTVQDALVTDTAPDVPTDSADIFLDASLDTLDLNSSDGQSTDVSVNDNGTPSDPGAPANDIQPVFDNFVPDTFTCDPQHCPGDSAPQWTLSVYQENPPLDKSFDTYAGKVTVVMLLAAH